jgi:hypothetical protein
VTSLDRSVTAMQRYTRVASVAGRCASHLGGSVRPPLVCAFDRGSGGLPGLDQISGEVIDMHERRARTSGDSGGTRSGSISDAAPWESAQTEGAALLRAGRGPHRLGVEVGGVVGCLSGGLWLDLFGSQMLSPGLAGQLAVQDRTQGTPT